MKSISSTSIIINNSFVVDLYPTLKKKKKRNQYWRWVGFHYGKEKKPWKEKKRKRKNECLFMGVRDFKNK